MTHWGWYWKVKQRHTPRKLCSSLTALDSFFIFKGANVAGFEISNCQLKASLVDDHLNITIGKRKSIAYQILFERLPCNYGGFRCFFRCPLCRQRMRLLYFTHNVFLCRKCLNLGYATQQLRTSRRYQYLEGKSKELVKNKGGDWELNKKPPRMHYTTFQKLKDKVFDYEGKARQALAVELQVWYGTKIEPYLDL